MTATTWIREFVDGKPVHPAGRKDDAGKPRWDLIPYEALEEVVNVLTHGAQKYTPDNWRSVPDWNRRYFAAAQRHLVAYFQGVDLDEDSDLPHLAHAACCILFLLAKELELNAGREE